MYSHNSKFHVSTVPLLPNPLNDAMSVGWVAGAQKTIHILTFNLSIYILSVAGILCTGYLLSEPTQN